MLHRKMIVAGGISLVAGAFLFVAVFSYLAANFNYPDVLDGIAAQVLPLLRNGGELMRSVWAVYAFLPLLLVPGGVGAYFACPVSRPRMSLALILVSLAALSMCLGLMRWPSMHWALAAAYAQAGPESQNSIAAVFDGLNLYLGNYIGEFLGETLLAGFFLLTGFSMLEEKCFPQWLGWGGICFALLFLTGALRNVAGMVQVIADINNVLLPLWMVVLGTALIWCTRHELSLGRPV